ncbi:MAG TPA: glycosyltransferase family 9 protein [Pyrinomonadaceae bacterium]|nr:glycosyltransferase family 9 protein [Pyrinomonadaceae bacterium]
MLDKNLEFSNILVLNFGQLGDVILSFPVMSAIREKFPNAKITFMGGKAVAEIVKLSGYSDAQIVVDRVKLRDSAKLWSIRQIFKLIGEVRREKFDFVIDLHSLSETNLLGFLSGAKKRLYSNRENRSLDFLSNFRPRPPLEDKSKHIAERYLDIIKPLEIENVKKIVQITPNQNDLEFVENLWQKHKLEKSVIGLFPGAGHLSRRWSLQNFSILAEFLSQRDSHQIAVFLGPEERDLRGEIEKIFPAKTVIFDNLNLGQFVAALSKLSGFVSNDTGPVHLAAAVGIPIVMLLKRSDFDSYHFSPLATHLRLLGKEEIDDINPEDVYQAVNELLTEKNSSF